MYKTKQLIEKENGEKVWAYLTSIKKTPITHELSIVGLSKKKFEVVGSRVDLTYTIVEE